MTPRTNDPRTQEDWEIDLEEARADFEVACFLSRDRLDYDIEVFVPWLAEWLAKER
jgi:hypothetical protein